MSILFWDKPRYAESHYKFRLPWSPLFRKRPEIIVDAPFQIVPGETFPLWIVVRDADRFPVRIESLRLSFKARASGNVGDSRAEQNTDVGASFHKIKSVSHFEYKLNISATESIAFYPVEISEAIAPGDYSITAELDIVCNGKKETIRNRNLPGLSKEPLHVQILGEASPKPAGYIACETHCHTHISADPVEFGARPGVLQKAARAIGLDAVFCTDHSYDFAFESPDYMRPTDGELRYRALKEEIATLPAYPRVIAGEEVSAGNAEGRNVHLLLPGTCAYVPGLGDCGRNWFKNIPTLPLTDILQHLGTPAFAAHPEEQMNAIERGVFRRGNWSHEDLAAGAPLNVRGMQFWNGSRDAGFTAGRALWIRELLRGARLLPIGGNDAHGDLNVYTGVKVPLAKLKLNRNHIFGYVRTVIQMPVANDPAASQNGARTYTEAEILGAFRGDNLYVTDGPALWWTRTAEGIQFTAQSTEDYGELQTVRIFKACKNEADETQEKEISLSIAKSTYKISEVVPAADAIYLRAECETSKGRFALTSAAFL